VYGNKKDKLPMENLIRWMATPNPQRSEKKKDSFTPEVIHDNSFLSSAEDKIVWMGHSSFYIQLNGVKLLTDPVFYDITPFLKRKHPLPCSIGHFKNIDYILLSHGHRDHLDVSTLKKLSQQNPSVSVLCPLRFKKMLQSIGFKHIQEAAWWQRYNVNEIDITFLPAKHWNRRLLTDYNTTLWGSFAIQTKDSSIYFAGDTGTGDHFKEIHKHFPAFNVCLMPVGAYKPKYVMEWAHTSPEDAVDAFNTLHGNTFVPMHYGTFDLSDEPASEPVKILKELKKEKKIKGDLEILKVGEPFILRRS
jgi:L-ascorbate metabolism protein UlaG (beta-lactamase superfamily)